MLYYLVRGNYAAKILVSDRTDDLSGLPREPIYAADFVFKVESDGTVEFLKKRSVGEYKHFFSLELALNHIRNWYNRPGFKYYPVEGFEYIDFSCFDYYRYKDASDKLTKKLREGVQ